MYWLIWLVIMLAIPIAAAIVVWRGQAAAALGGPAGEPQATAPAAAPGDE